MSWLVEAWSAPAAPPIELLTSDWADTHRVLPRTSAVRGARWRTDLTPYLRDVMNVVHEPGISKVALMKAAQVGGSEAMHNIIGRQMHHDPCPTLMIHPTLGDAEEWSKDRLEDMLSSTPELAAVMRGSGTLTYKEYIDGYLALGGANTPNSFARRSVRMALGEDVDRWPAVVGDEGDPEALLEDRTTTFEDAICVFVSTPTLKDGRIDSLYQRSDQRRYFVCCPGCHRWDWVTWSDATHFHVRFDGRDVHSARLECANPECHAKMHEPERRAMIAEGQWRKTAAPKEPGLAGFHLPIMLSTFPSVTLAYMVAKWLAAHEAGTESIRAFINTKLAEGWEDKGQRTDPQALMARKEDYGDGIDVPAWAVALTCAVDVQHNRFELMVVAWGFADERAVVHRGVVEGDPKMADTQAKLIAELDRKFTHASGALLPIHATAIDTGHLATEMYRFVLAHQGKRRLYAVKGQGGKTGNPIMGKPIDQLVGNQKIRRYMVNTDDAKLNIADALKKEHPDKAPGQQPSSIHFPMREFIDEEFFAQLCSEQRVVIRNKRKVAVGTVWEKLRERNEILDLMVYNLAAFRQFNPNIRQMLEALPKERATARVDSQASAPAPAAPQKRSRVIGTMNPGGTRR